MARETDGTTAGTRAGTTGTTETAGTTGITVMAGTTVIATITAPEVGPMTEVGVVGSLVVCRVVAGETGMIATEATARIQEDSGAVEAEEVWEVEVASTATKEAGTTKTEEAVMVPEEVPRAGATIKVQVGPHGEAGINHPSRTIHNGQVKVRAKARVLGTTPAGKVMASSSRVSIKAMASQLLATILRGITTTEMGTAHTTGTNSIIRVMVFGDSSLREEVQPLLLQLVLVPELCQAPLWVPQVQHMIHTRSGIISFQIMVIQPVQVQLQLAPQGQLMAASKMFSFRNPSVPV